jgi:hypothetical protein
MKVFCCLKTVKPQPLTSESLSKDIEVDAFYVEVWVTLDKLSVVYSCCLSLSRPKLCPLISLLHTGFVNVRLESHPDAQDH